MLHIIFLDNNFEYEIIDTAKLFFDNEHISCLYDCPDDISSLMYFLLETKNIDGSEELVVQFGCEGNVRSVSIPLTLNGNGSLESVPGIYPLTREEMPAALQIKKRAKWSVKGFVFDCLNQVTGKTVPWGMLTGIRPSKIVHELIENGCGKDKTINILNGFYKVSANKAELLWDIAVAERSVIERTPKNSIGLYIGIPFCPTRCLYCSFTSNPADKYGYLMGPYIEALKTEMQAADEIIREKGSLIQSIYIGGGTPTALSPELLKELLGMIRDSFDLSGLEEYTVEAGRPDTIDDEKLEIIKDSGAGRISINPQTMNDSTLKLIGRRHTPEDTADAFGRARKAGFDNINMDIIVGLPGETRGMFEETLKQIELLGPESLTVHTLAIKRASKLNEDKKSFELTGARGAEQMVEIGGDFARRMGMRPYYLYRQKNILGNLENIGYCKPGYECIYNIQIMEERQTIIALGPGGVTKAFFPEENRIERAFNVKNIEEYIGRINEMIERKRKLIFQK